MLPCLSKSFGLSEQPNKNLRGCGEDYFWELDHLGLNFSGWRCWLFTENTDILVLCFMFCSAWELLKINAQFSPSSFWCVWLCDRHHAFLGNWFPCVSQGRKFAYKHCFLDAFGIEKLYHNVWSPFYTVFLRFCGFGSMLLNFMPMVLQFWKEHKAKYLLSTGKQLLGRL